MIHYYNVAKVHLIRDAMYRRRAEECPGCRDDQANQLGHMTDYGVGCLDDAMPQQWFHDAYNSLRLIDVERLYSRLVTQQQPSSCDGEILIGDALKEAVYNELFDTTVCMKWN